MLEETFILSKLPLSFERGESISIHVLSSFIYILKISTNKQVFLYIYNVRQCKESTFELIWHDPALTVNSCFVSPDGYLFILTENNDLHFYNVVEQEVFLERELLFMEFMELLKYSGFPMKNAQFKPLALGGNNLVLASGNRWLIVMTWNFSPKVVKDFMVSCIDLGVGIKSITSNKQYIFCLNSIGDILVHKAIDALFLIRLSVGDWQPWKEGGLGMIALSLEDEMMVALADAEGHVSILDISAAFNDAMNLNVDSCSNVSSEKSHKTTTSSYSTTSRTSATSGFSSQANVTGTPTKQLLNYNVFNDAWSSYLLNLKKCGTSGQAHSSHTKNLANDVIKLNLNPDQGEIKKLHVNDRGFSVLTYLDASTSLYRLFDRRSGQLKFRAELPLNCEVVSLSASDVTLDLLVVDNSLRLPLCAAPKHVFLNKLLRCVDESKIALLLEGWDEMRSPVTLLLASVADGQLDNVHLALNLHAQLFKLEATGQEVGGGARTAEILGALDGVVCEATESKSAGALGVSEQFVRQIRGLQLTHCYRLLTLLDEIAIPIQAKAGAAGLRHKLMECIMRARSALEKSGATASRSGETDPTAAPHPVTAPLPQNSVEWVLWEGMADAELLRAGIDRLSAVQCFLAVRRQWTPDQLGGARFKQLTVQAAEHLAGKEDLAGALHLLQHAGYNATEELKTICLTTLNASLREFLIKNMDDILNDEEEENYMFLSLVLDVMIRYDGSSNAEEEIAKKLCLTISSVKALSQDKKSMILTELFFKTWDILLLDKLNSTTCWQYLIEKNCLDLLKLWIGHESPPENCPDWPQQWPITQPMVDWIIEADCLDSTRLVVLDWLASDGIFTTKCKENVKNVLHQLGRVKLLGCYEQVLDDELNRSLLQFASDRNMIDLVVSLTKELPDFYSKCMQDTERTDKDWLQLWKAFIKVDDNWEQETILELVQKTADYIASNGNMDAYLQSHPSVALAIAILQNKSLVEIENAQSISPLLAVGVQSEDELNCKKQTSLYALLSATTAFQTDNLFQWQRKRISHQESAEPALFPHFGCSELSAKFGHRQTVQYVDYLHNARPSFAFLQFFQENSRAQGKIPLRMQKRAANVAHGLALRSAVLCGGGERGGGGGGASAATCVAFVEMLCRTSLPLRVHLAAITAIRHSTDTDDLSRQQELNTTIEGLVSNNPLHAAKLLQMLETAISAQLSDLSDVIGCLKLWHLPVRLALQHNLPLPVSLPRQVARDNRWLLFLLSVSIFGYTKQQALELLTSFTSATYREHLQYALKFEVDCEGHAVAKKDGDEDTCCDSESSLVVHVARHGGDLKRFLTQTRTLQSPGLALLSSILDPNNVVASFCEWLVASLPSPPQLFCPVSPLDWCPTDIANLLNHVVSLSFINTLQHAFTIFLPDNPLYYVAKFLVDSIVHREFERCVEDLESFKTSLKLLENVESGSFESVEWVCATAVRLCTTALIRCFPSYSQQHTFLKTICKVDLQASLPLKTVEPDFRLLLALTEYMMQEGSNLDYTEIYDVSSGRLEFEKQLATLIEGGKFSMAHSFATIAGLSHCRILLVEWKERAKANKMADDFWSGCDAAFLAGNLPADDAVRFYLELNDGAQSQEEQYKLLKYALKWAKKLHLSNSETTKDNEILLKLYNLYLEDNFNVKLILDDITFKPIKTFKSSMVNRDTLRWLRMNRPAKKLSDAKLRRLDTIIGKLLDVGDLSTVWCLETLYDYKNKDSLLIDGCLGLAEGEFTTDSLPETFTDLLTNISTSHSVHGLRTSNYRHIKSVSLSLSCYSFQDLEDLSEVDELNETIDAVCKLSEQVAHGARLMQYVTAALRVADAYQLSYKEVIELDSPLSLLIEQGCSQLQLARDILTLAALSDSDAAIFVCSQLVACIRQPATDDSAATLYGCQQLSQVLQLAADQLKLGQLLMKAAQLAGSSSAVSWQTVELLVLAHTCFTRACNMQGISAVLTLCRRVVDSLVLSGKWKLMVRLMTGVGRYTEMRYVFHLLKDNNQFECLLSNVRDDEQGGLKSATLDFARGDQDLFTLVALHFGMYADLAGMFKEAAAASLHALKHAPAADGKSLLVRSEMNERYLQSAIDDYTHAAQHYIQGERMGSATQTVAKAELVALQLSHLRAVPMGSGQHSLLGLTGAEACRLVASGGATTSYEEVCTLVRGSCGDGGAGVEWSDAIFVHYVQNGNQQFLKSWMQHHTLSAKVVHQVVRRFQLEKSVTATMEKNMKQFVQMISLTDLKYRVCSQLGFKDILHSLLSGPDLPYLKDTVWRSGFKKQHL